MAQILKPDRPGAVERYWLLDSLGKDIGSVEVKADGRERALNSQAEVLGYYDSKTNRTYNTGIRIVALRNAVLELLDVTTAPGRDRNAFCNIRPSLGRQGNLGGLEGACMQRQVILNSKHERIGYVEVESSGRQRVLDTKFHIVGYYDPQTNRTLDQNFHAVAVGNFVVSLLCKR